MPFTKPQRKFLIARWLYAPKGALVQHPVSEDVYETIEAVAKDIRDGQVLDVTQVVSIDLDAGTAKDVTRDAFECAADMTIADEREPFEKLADKFDTLGIAYFGQQARDRRYLDRRIGA